MTTAQDDLVDALARRAQAAALADDMARLGADWRALICEDRTPPADTEPPRPAPTIR